MERLARIHENRRRARASECSGDLVGNDAGLSDTRYENLAFGRVDGFSGLAKTVGKIVATMALGMAGRCAVCCVVGLGRSLAGGPTDL